MAETTDSNSPAEDALGVLREGAAFELGAVDATGRTSQVHVSLPRDEDLLDSDVVDDETPIEGLTFDTSALPIHDPREDNGAPPTIVIELDEDDEELPESARESDLGEVRADEADEFADGVLDGSRTIGDEGLLAEDFESSRDISASAGALDEGGETREAIGPDPAPDTTVDVTTADVSRDTGDDTSAWEVLAEEIEQDENADLNEGSSAPQQSTTPADLAAAGGGQASISPEPGRPRELAPRKLEHLSEQQRESDDLLTADRLIDPANLSRPEPEGVWSHFVYRLSGGRINLGDSKSVKERKRLSARIAAPLTGDARFVSVLSRKGGVGKTTIATLVGMALADAREDRVIAIDANPDRGTLAHRIARSPSKAARDLVRGRRDIRGYHDLASIVIRDTTRLDVLASDDDPRSDEAFTDSDFREVADLASRYYSLILTDTGTGIVHSVMGATLEIADQLIIVSGVSIDEARLASQTLTWLENNGHEQQARDAIVVVSQPRPGKPLIRVDELVAHFTTRVRTVVHMPYDPHIAAGDAITFASLQPETRLAARELAAEVVEALRAKGA